MIYKKCIMTINKNNATLDEDIYLFRLDKNIELHFTIVNNKYKFDKSDLNNIIAQTNAAYFQIRLYRSDEIKYTFAIQPTQDGVAVLTITNDLIDDPIELGEYDFQISLLDADKTSMISMPIVKQQLHVCEPLVDNQAIMGRAVLGLSSLASGEIKNAFDSEGNYIREIHKDGDILSAQLINKFEEALDTNTKAIKNQDILHTISSKVLATVPASSIKLDNNITVNNVSINKDRRYYIEFLGSKKLCSLLISEDMGNSIVCSIGNYAIQAINVEQSTNLSLFINNTNADDTTTVTFTDLIIYEEEVKYLDSKYLETDLVLQNSISLGRIGNIGACSSAIGCEIEASGDSSHAEGGDTTASGYSSHAEGNGTTASGDSSHAEGDTTTASGYSSHTEGDTTTASGNNSHAEGGDTTASGYSSHAEGSGTTASGISSHAEGSFTHALDEDAHAEGSNTIASSMHQHVQGRFNIEDTANKYAHIVGNGTGNNDKRSNAHTLDWEGNGWYAGKLSQEGTPTEDKDLATKKYVDDNTVILPLPVHTIQETTATVIKVVNIMDLVEGVAYSTHKDPNETRRQSYRVAYVCDDGSFKLICTLSLTNKIVHLLKVVHSTKNNYSTLSYNNLAYKVDYTKHNTNTDIQVTGTLQNYIPIANNIEYNPTKEYHPATKKYVDDRFVCTDLMVNVGTIPKEEMQKCNNGGRYVSSINLKEFFKDYQYCVYQGTYGDKKIRMKYDAQYNRIIAYDLDIADTYNIMLGFDFDTNYMYPFNGAATEVKAYQFTNDLVITKSPVLNPSEVLTKNNTKEYTPTNDYNPATKKYVDDNILLEQLPILRMDETNKRIYVNCNAMGTYKKYFVPNKYANVYSFSFIYTNDDNSEKEIALVGGAMTRDDFILCARNTNTLFILILGGCNKYTYTKSTKVLETGLYGYLKIANTYEYTPTENYHPATKKYVDDKITSSPQLSFNETGELVVTINGVSKTFVPKG